MRISDWSSDVCSSDLGEPIINVTNINTVNGSHTTIDRVRYQAPNVEFDYDHELWYDDVRVDLDTIDYIPEGRYALLPYASDDSVAWTPSTAGDNYPMIDERSEEHTSELQSLMRISYAVFCLTKKQEYKERVHHNHNNNIS